MLFYHPQTAGQLKFKNGKNKKPLKIMYWPYFRNYILGPFCFIPPTNIHDNVIVDQKKQTI